MLGKLLKYEFKATGRIFFPLYIALAAFALINRFLLSYESSNVFLNAPQVIGKISYALLIVAIFVLTFVIMIQRFYKNLLSEEGYLMFTLPVKSRDHIFSKLLVSFCWNLASFLVILGSLAILLVTPENFRCFLDFLAKAWPEIQAIFGSHTVLLILEFTAILLIGTICSTLMIYTAISIGQLFSRHKLAGSFLAYIGLSFVSQMISSVMVGVVSIASPSVFNAAEPPIWFIHTMLLGSMGLSIVLAVGYFIVTNYLLTRKLNLE